MTTHQSTPGVHENFAEQLAPFPPTTLLQVRPGDRFVVRSDRPLSKEMMHHLKENWRQFAGDEVKLLILDKGFDLSVIRDEETPSPQSHVIGDDGPRYSMKRMRDEIAKARAHGLEIAAELVERREGEIPERQEIAKEIRSLAPSPVQHLRVKSLVWSSEDVLTWTNREGNEHPASSYWEGKSPIAGYQVSKFTDERFPKVSRKFCLRIGYSTKELEFDTLDQAKEAAETHYRQLVEALLEPQPPVSKPEAGS